MSVVVIVIIIIIPTLKMKDPRPRRLKELAQSHRLGKLRYRDLTPGYQSPEWLTTGPNPTEQVKI